ncbi:hypothetical protein ACFL5O_00920 [Myxococcota bacterium]
MMVSKFAQCLSDSGVDPRRLVSTSRKLERLRPEDRRIRLERRQARSDESQAQKKQFAKTRSGRPLTSRQLQRAVDGKPIPSPVKTRLLRAMNQILEQKKKSPIGLRDLF